MQADLLSVNGIDGSSGAYLAPDWTIEDIAALAQNRPPESREAEELRRWARHCLDRHLGPHEGIDPKNLAEAGWGVIFPVGAATAIRAALAPLLDLRRCQAGGSAPRGRFRLFVGQDGYRPGESKTDFLARHGAGPGPAVPRLVPYYLLLVGSPEKIPYQFQYQLDVQYAVGRIDFDSPEEYRRYAEAILAVEMGEVRRRPHAFFFGTRHEDDLATHLSCDELVRPLAFDFGRDEPDWKVETVTGGDATKARLLTALRDPDGMGLIFTASHGLGFPAGHPLQRVHSGALLCQDWPGPRRWAKPIPPDHYLGADDLGVHGPGSVRPHGLVLFHFACYSAGCPALDNFPQRFGERPRTIAPRPFSARLLQGLLSHRQGGALAAVGHVDRAWDCSFRWPGVGAQRQTFLDTLRRLKDGHPVGSAMEPFNLRYAELAADLAEEIADIRFGKRLNPEKVAGLWIHLNDARNYLVFGDPAVRLAVAGLRFDGESKERGR